METPEQSPTMHAWKVAVKREEVEKIEKLQASERRAYVLEHRLFQLFKDRTHGEEFSLSEKMCNM